MMGKIFLPFLGLILSIYYASAIQGADKGKETLQEICSPVEMTGSLFIRSTETFVDEYKDRSKTLSFQSEYICQKYFWNFLYKNEYINELISTKRILPDAADKYSVDELFIAWLTDLGYMNSKGGFIKWKY